MNGRMAKRLKEICLERWFVDKKTMHLLTPSEEAYYHRIHREFLNFRQFYRAVKKNYTRRLSAGL